MSESDNTFAFRLVEAMEVKVIEAISLEAETSISSDRIISLMQGAAPEPEEIVNLAAALRVPAGWLEAGAGPRPAASTEQERSEYQARAGWQFRAVPPDGGRDYGNANIWSFRPDLEALVRETGQNASDQGSNIELVYRLIVLKGQDLQHFLAAVSWPQLEANIRSAASGTQKLSRFLKAGLDKLDAGELWLLRIEDSNTTGLTGGEYQPGNFMALTRNNLDSQKLSASAGGAYGLGKATLHRSSNLSTVLYNSNVRHVDGEHRLNRVFGRSELGYHPAQPDDHAGPGWFGTLQGEKAGCAESYWGNATLARDLYLDRDPGQTGTSILIVGFNDPSGEAEKPGELIAGLSRAAARHFWPAIVSGRMRIRVQHADGRRVTSSLTVNPDEQLPEFSQLARAHAAGDVDEELTGLGDSARVVVPLQLPPRRMPGSTKTKTLGEHHAVLLVRLAEKADAPQVNTIAYHRGTQMVVKYDELRNAAGVRPFHAIVRCGEAAGGSQTDLDAETFLRAAEPPAHDTWTSTADLKVDYLPGGKKALDDFFGIVRREILKLVAPIHQVADDGPRALRDLLTIEGPPPLPPAQPYIKEGARGGVDSQGRWWVEATVVVRPQPGKPWKGRLVGLFGAQSGSGLAIQWESIEPVKDCTTETNDVLIIPEGKREGAFRAFSKPTSHPVAADLATFSIDFRVLAS